MGIKNLSAVLQKYCPFVYEDTHISHFAGKKLAVDVSGNLYRYIATNPKGWLNTFIMFFCSLKRHQIRPIVVFDGAAPPEKARTKAKRQDEKEKIHTRVKDLDNLVFKITQYSQTKEIDDFEQVKSKVEQTLDKLFKDQLVLISTPDDLVLYVNELSQEMDRLNDQCIYITHEHTRKLTLLIDLLGIPRLQAEGEAETLCAYLCRHGYVDGVITEDTDVLAYGVSNFISKYSSNGKCVLLQHDKILENLDLTAEEFTDLCIMCGTDYNDNIKGIGAIKAYDKIHQYGTLDKISDNTQLDLTILNYQNGRRLFSVPETFVCDVPRTLPPDFPELGLFLLENNCTITLGYIRKAWEPVELVFDDDDNDEEEEE